MDADDLTALDRRTREMARVAESMEGQAGEVVRDADDAQRLAHVEALARETADLVWEADMGQDWTRDVQRDVAGAHERGLTYDEYVERADRETAYMEDHGYPGPSLMPSVDYGARDRYRALAPAAERDDADGA